MFTSKKARYFVAVTVMTGYVGTAGAQQQRTQWDGVYTREQAARGEIVYAESCASCHGTHMMGGEMAPPLTGNDFMASWADLSLNDLFERIRISMPQDKPGSLSRNQNADVVSFILQKGEFPAGQAELPAETEVLKEIKIAAANPSAK